jgi:glycosyltransferase involved in cell wall biosynthesis
MKTSIITATYNSEQTLASAIESVLRQIYPVVEYTIMFLLLFN